MPDYFVFGGCLRSELTFPELTHSHGRAANWVLRIGTLPRNDDAEVLSDIELSPTCRTCLTRGDGWFRYFHSCTGSFEVFADGRRILFEPAAQGDLDGARTDFVSQVLPFCVNHTSITWIEGSAVRIGGGAVAFLGPAGSGKSTLALALTGGGADLGCDDTLPIEAGVNPVIWRSDDVIRLCSDSRGRLAPLASPIRRESNGKFVMTRRQVGPPPSSFACDPSDRTALSAIYVLNPRDASTGSPASRQIVSPTAGLSTLMQHLKLGAVITREAPARLLNQLFAIVQAVPIYELTFSHDWLALGELVERLNGWHTHAGAAHSAFVQGERISA